MNGKKTHLVQTRVTEKEYRRLQRIADANHSTISRDLRIMLHTKAANVNGDKGKATKAS